MDPLTHGLIGASFAQSKTTSAEIRYGALAGLLGGMAPDLDIVIRSDSDPLLGLMYHRHFTHALVFVPFGAALVAGFLWLFLRNRIRFSRLYLFAFIGFALHGLVDALTTYGTHIFWPFSPERTSWDLVAIIDPLIMIPLLIGIIFTLVTRAKKPVYAAMIWVLLYLGLNGLQQHRVEKTIAELAEQRGHDTAHHIRAMPSIFNNIVWRSVYRNDDTYYVDAVRVTWDGRVKIYEGGSLPVLDISTDLPWLATAPQQKKDVARFSFFADGLLAIYPDDPTVITDVRYGMLPNSTRPMWGIKLDPSQKDSHVTFQRFMRASDRSWTTFKAMLMGHELPKS